MADHDESKKRNTNIFSNMGFRVGLVSGLFLGIISILSILIYNGKMGALFISRMFGLFIYFFTAQSAASKQYQKQKMNLDYNRGYKRGWSRWGICNSNYFLVDGFYYMGNFGHLSK